MVCKTIFCAWKVVRILLAAIRLVVEQFKWFIFEEFLWAVVVGAAGGPKKNTFSPFSIKWTNINHLFEQMPSESSTVTSSSLSKCLQQCDISICLLASFRSAVRVIGWRLFGHEAAASYLASIPIASYSFDLSYEAIQDIWKFEIVISKIDCPALDRLH